MVNRKTPEPPTNPPEPEYTHEEHNYEKECSDRNIDIDGPSRKIQDNTEYNVSFVVFQEHRCRRDGCDAKMSKKLLFAVEDFCERDSSLNDSEDIYERGYEYDGVWSVRIKNKDTGDYMRVEPREVKTEEDGGLCTGKPPRV